MKRVLLLVSLLVVTDSLSAQTPLVVPYDTSIFSWAAPIDPPVAGVGVTRWHVINCGAADKRIDLPATSIPVKSVVQPGTYTCTLKAVNNFGPSAAVAFPTFDAGYIPAPPANLRIGGP